MCKTLGYQAFPGNLKKSLQVERTFDIINTSTAQLPPTPNTLSSSLIQRNDLNNALPARTRPISPTAFKIRFGRLPNASFLNPDVHPLPFISPIK